VTRVLDVVRRHRWLVLVVVAGAIVRVAWATYAARNPLGLHDPGFYRLLATQLATGEGYAYLDGLPTAYYPPGYPLSLVPAAFLIHHDVLPESWWAGTIVTLNVLWQSVAMLATADIARRVTGRAAAGIVAAAVLALWPNLVHLAMVPLTESLFLALVTTALAIAVRAPWSSGWEPWRVAAVGALLGGATLVRPITAPVFPLLVVALLVSRVGWRRALTTTVGVAGVAAIVLLPWVVRNAIQMDAITLSTNTGDNTCMSRFVGSTGGFNFLENPCFDGRFDELERPAYETEGDSYRRSFGLEFVREHPGEEARLWLRRLGATFHNDADGVAALESYGDDPFLDDGLRKTLRRVSNAYALVALVVAVPGVVLLVRRGPPGVLVVVATFGMLLPVVLFFGDPRFKVPVLPAAAIAIATLAYGRATSRST
jgi:4-amino-4-deoxy-L-arabinose transferase-like glycosyltransferase